MFQVQCLKSTTNKTTELYSKYSIGPFLKGQSTTIGNALRRVLLSNLQGLAITGVRITDVDHEFSTIPNVKEDVVDILLNVKQLVLKQADLIKKSGCDGIVCSAHEIYKVRKICKRMEIITPGIRLNSKLNDQKRVMSPKKAVTMGSDWLVIGRSITNGNIKRNMKNLIDHLLK